MKTGGTLTMENQNKKKQETLSPKNVNPLNPENIYSDVLGSYTGVTEDGDIPIQDADDL